MDDAANWAGYNVSGELNLFSGFTRIVNTKLLRPARIGSVLKLTGQILRVKNRTDVIIRCNLTDPEYSNALHCEADCVFVMNESAAEMLEPIVARRQKKRGNSGSGPDEMEPAAKEPWSKTWTSDSSETIADPVFRPPNRVGRYGLGQRIGDEIANKIDEKTARHYIPPSGSLIRNAEKNVIKNKQAQEAERLQAQEEIEAARIRNHPSRIPWPRSNNSSG